MSVGSNWPVTGSSVRVSLQSTRFSLGMGSGQQRQPGQSSSKTVRISSLFGTRLGSTRSTDQLSESTRSNQLTQSTQSKVTPRRLGKEFRTRTLISLTIPYFNIT
ncbi:hypothetical protein Hdeb2414_s0012g00380451 [Helianthus debilis subsp. tardiflorus]